MRLCLLSDNSLKFFLNESLALKRNNECNNLIKNVLKAKSKHHSKDLATRHRCCDQNMFNVLFCGGFCRFNGYSRKVNEVYGRNLGNFTKSGRFQSSLFKRRSFCVLR